jgi:hypothetical protein
MADAELAIAQKVLQLLRSGNLVRGDKSLDEAEVLAFEQSAIRPRDDVRQAAWLMIFALRESIDDGEELNALKLNHAFAMMQTERWIEARIAFLLESPSGLRLTRPNGSSPRSAAQARHRRRS